LSQWFDYRGKFVERACANNQFPVESIPTTLNHLAIHAAK
jgi:hypothetical protein